MFHLVAALPATRPTILVLYELFRFFSLLFLRAIIILIIMLRLLPALILSISCLMLVQDTFTGNLLEAGRKTDSDLYEPWRGFRGL